MILLDTSILIRIAGGGPFSPAAAERIEAEEARSGLLVSAVTAWEIGTLAMTTRTGLLLLPDARTWLARATARPGFRLLPLTAHAAVEAGHLPGDFHRDPADRLLVSVAREEKIAIMTNDRRILAYAAAGHVEAIAA